MIFGEDHKRQFNEQQEKGATFMAGELLIPLAAAERMAFDGWDNAQVAAAYGVSARFAQMQMKGQRVRAQRAALKRGFGASAPVRKAERWMAYSPRSPSGSTAPNFAARAVAESG